MKKAVILVIVAGTTLLAAAPLSAQRPERREPGKARGAEILKRLDQRLDRMEKALRAMGRNLKKLGAKTRVQEKRLQGLEKGGAGRKAARGPEGARHRLFLGEAKAPVPPRAGSVRPEERKGKRLQALRKRAQAYAKRAQVHKRRAAVARRLQARRQAAPGRPHPIRARLERFGRRHPQLEARVKQHLGRVQARRLHAGMHRPGRPLARGEGRIGRQAVIRFLRAHPRLARALKAYFTAPGAADPRPGRASLRPPRKKAPELRRRIRQHIREQREAPRRFHL